MKHSLWPRALLAGVLLTSGAVALNFVALLSPRSTLGWNRFHLLYDRTDDKSGFLDDYRTRIMDHGGGYVPDATAGFLARRLEVSNDPREVSAIVHFDALQAGGREAGALFHLSDRARRRVALTVLSDWKTYPQAHAEHAFVLIEGLRKNTMLGKANVIGPHFDWADSREKVAPVAALFERWNRHYSATPFVERPDPLAGSPYVIEAP